MSIHEPILPATLVTTYLHMTSIDQFRPAYRSDVPDVQIEVMRRLDLDYYLFLYESVGSLWRWRDRLRMPRAELAAALSVATVHVLYVESMPAGYIEIAPDAHDETALEIAYFGLRPGYMGRGLGKHLLSYGIQRAWLTYPRCVTVHTCNLDSPQALPNYTARGFMVDRVVEEPMPQHYA